MLRVFAMNIPYPLIYVYCISNKTAVNSVTGADNILRWCSSKINTGNQNVHYTMQELTAIGKTTEYDLFT